MTADYFEKNPPGTQSGRIFTEGDNVIIRRVAARYVRDKTSGRSSMAPVTNRRDPGTNLVVQHPPCNTV